MSWKEYQKTGTLGTENKRTLTLLIVDDERGILNTLEESFRDMFKVHTANSGQEALQIFRDKEVHLVLSDQRMPEMTGVELFSKLKAINPVPVRILITGYADINVVIRGLNEGLMWQYVTKPWDTEELKTLLRRAAQHYLKETQNDEPDPIRGLSF
jgi:YesN/AraC family two-component response regulator